jgi:hypothetical protein
MGDQKVTAATPIAIHTAATGAALATAPTADLFTARSLYQRNGAILIEPEGGGATLAAPTLLGRIRGTSRWVDLGAIDRLTGGDLVLASGVGRALAIRDALAYCDRFWVKSATVTGTVNVSFVPLETYE